MKTRNIILKSMLLLLSFGIFSCSDDFLDVNQNPNDPSVSNPSLALPVAQDEFTYLNSTSMVYLGQFMVYNWAVPSNWSAQGDLIRYNITNGFYSNIFETSYIRIFKDLTYIQNYEDPSGAVDYSAYDAIAQTMKGFQYQILVDLYGDVPYTEANLRSGNPTPAYDDAEFIYKSVIDSLTKAATTALALPENAENPGDQDIIFYGDMTSWAQFANTIKLRMLVRLSNTGQDQYIKDQIALITANGAGFIEESVTANPGYSDNAGKQSPLYGYIGEGPNGAALDRQDYTVATDFAIDYLVGTNDPRMDRLYSEAVEGGYKGAPQATALPGEGFTSEELSHIGPGLVVSSEQDQIIMPLAEALLIQAEAVVRGYMTGDAKALYEEAIEETFDRLGVSDEFPAEDYYSQNIENVGWDASPNKIEAIMTQKWIALNGVASIQSWIDLTRTGYPDFLPIPAESEGVRPVRLLYPLSELSANADNVPAQVVTDAFTNYPFWK